MAPPSALVIGASGLPDVLPPGVETAPPSAATVLPVAETTPPTLDTTGAFVPVSDVPTFATVPPTVCSKLVAGAPRPVVLPSVCVAVVTCEVSGTTVELSCCVTCSTGPVDRAVPSVPPALATACPTCETAPPTGEVTGASGCSGPVPRPVTRPPVALTVLPTWVTTLPVLATVVPTGFGLVPMLPTPDCTPVPSAETVLPTLSTTLPKPVAPGALEPATVPPTPLMAPPVAESTPPPLLATSPVGVVDAVVVDPPVPPEVPELPEPLLPLLAEVPPPLVPLMSPEPELAQPPRISSPASVAETSAPRCILVMSVSRFKNALDNAPTPSGHPFSNGSDH